MHHVLHRLLGKYTMINDRSSKEVPTGFIHEGRGRAAQLCGCSSDSQKERRPLRITALWVAAAGCPAAAEGSAGSVWLWWSCSMP